MKYKTKKFLEMCVEGMFGKEREELYKELLYKYKNRKLTQEDKDFLKLLDEAIYPSKRDAV